MDPSKKHQRYLIIGGTGKAGTTSLFYYLADHPQICSATVKETRFFLDPDYPEKAVDAYYDGSLDKYDAFFRHCTNPDAVRLEASPQYLNSPGTCKRLKEALPEAKIVFSIRNPISRLMSIFRFGQQMGFIEQGIDINEFIEKQFYRVKNEPAKKHLISLATGNYSEYLRPYFDSFGKKSVHVIFFEDLIKEPRSVLTSICNFTGIAENFYRAYQFRIHNESRVPRNKALINLYYWCQDQIKKRTYSLPLLHGTLRRCSDSIGNILLTKIKKGNDVSLTSENQSRLKEYYSTEIVALQELLERSIPWN